MLTLPEGSIPSDVITVLTAFAPLFSGRTFAPVQVLLCTDAEIAPEQIVSWFIERWQAESTFQQVRTHLGVETQRQWNDQAIARTTPALLGLFSLVTLLADPSMKSQKPPIRQAAWYVKDRPTFRTLARASDRSTLLCQLMDKV